MEINPEGKIQGTTPPSNRASMDVINGGRNGLSMPSVPAVHGSASSPAVVGTGGVQPHPIVKIGHYVLGETLGVGTFGKVKSKFVPKFISKELFFVAYNP